jgi:hypothetical protein
MCAKNPANARSANLLACAFFIVCCGLAVGASADDAKNFRWKAVDGSVVKLDDKVPLTWNVFQLEKKKQSNLILILLGRRYILLDSKTKLAYLVALSDLHAQGQGFDSGDLAQSPHIIPSVDWTIRDVGPAEEIRLTLKDYGRLLSVQLPHTPDLRLGIY